ncbi:MAG: hypothetical protein AAF587_20880 [Bacteroidota bacterium]
MRHLSDYDPFEQFIQSRVEEFAETPSEAVWEGLEKRWDTSSSKGFFRSGFRGNFFWLMVCFTTLFGTAIWGLTSLQELETLQPDLVQMKASYIHTSGQDMSALVQNLSTAKTSNTPYIFSQKSLGYTSNTLKATSPDTFLPPTSSSREDNASIQAISPIQIKLDLDQDIEMPAVPLTKAEPQSRQPKSEPEPKTKKKAQKKKKSKPSTKFGSRDWWSSPRSWNKGRSWDYQIGVQAMTENYLGKWARSFNSVSSNYEIHLLGEWVPNHRIRLGTGLSFGGHKFDYGSRLFEGTGYSLVNILNTYYEASIDSLDVQDITVKESGMNISIPLHLLLFFTPPDHETHIYGGGALILNVTKQNNYQYGIQRISTPETEWIATDHSFLPDLFVGYRLLLGVEQRLSKALRIRAQAHLALGRSAYPLENRYGGAISIYWASPRGPLRWRKPRRDRAL